MCRSVSGKGDTPCQHLGVRNFTLNQYMGSVNHNMDKKSIFWVHKSEKRRIVEFGANPKNIRPNIWGTQKLGLIYGDQQRNSGMDAPGIES